MTKEQFQVMFQRAKEAKVRWEKLADKSQNLEQASYQMVYLARRQCRVQTGQLFLQPTQAVTKDNDEKDDRSISASLRFGASPGRG